MKAIHLVKKIHKNDINILICPYPGKKGTLDCKLDWYPKFYKHFILFIGQNVFGILIEF